MYRRSFYEGGGTGVGPGSDSGGSAVGGGGGGGGFGPGNAVGGGGTVGYGGGRGPNDPGFGNYGGGGTEKNPKPPYVPPPPPPPPIPDPGFFAANPPEYSSGPTVNVPDVKTSIIADQYARMLNVPFFQAFENPEAPSDSIFNRKNLLTAYTRTPDEQYTATARGDIEEARRISDQRARSQQANLTGFNPTTRDTTDVLRRSYQVPTDTGGLFSIKDLLEMRGPAVDAYNIEQNIPQLGQASMRKGELLGLDRNYSVANYDVGQRGGLTDFYNEILNAADGGRVDKMHGGMMIMDNTNNNIVNSGIGSILKKYNEIRSEL